MAAPRLATRRHVKVASRSKLHSRPHCTCRAQQPSLKALGLSVLTVPKSCGFKLYKSNKPWIPQLLHSLSRSGRPLQAPASSAAPDSKRIERVSATGSRLKITRPLSVHLPAKVPPKCRLKAQTAALENELSPRTEALTAQKAPEPCPLRT